MPLEKFNSRSQTWDKKRHFYTAYEKEHREKIKDSLDEVIVCGKCGESIKRRSEYDHNRNKHSDATEIYKWNCSDYALTFKHEKLYKNHLRCESHLTVVKMKNLDGTMISEDAAKTFNIPVKTIIIPIKNTKIIAPTNKALVDTTIIKKKGIHMHSSWMW